MPFEIIRADIAQLSADAIVNSANPQPIIGAGVDERIHQAAGPKLLEARQKIGPIPHGSCAITAAFDLDAKYVIHAVGPKWIDGKHDEITDLITCYGQVLNLAKKHGCKSIALPLISSGYYGFPKDAALETAIWVFNTFLKAHDMQIYLVVYDRESYKLSENLFGDVASYIDEHYPQRRRQSLCTRSRRRQEPQREECYERVYLEECLSLDDYLRGQDAGFVQTLLTMIEQRGLKKSQVYKKANISKQHFSKLTTNRHATVTKTTAVAFALALELDMEETLDLIGRAGYTLSNSSVFDLIIRYHIEHKKYNVVEINCVLFEFDQPLIGSV